MKPIGQITLFFTTFLGCVGALYAYHNYFEPKIDNQIVVVEQQKPQAATEPAVTNETLPAPKTLTEALEQANKTNRKVLVMMSGKTCPPCRLMKEKTLVDPSIKQIIKDNYIFLLGEDNDALIAKFKPVGVPAYRILDANGKILAKDAGYMNVKTFTEFLQSVKFVVYRPSLFERIMARRKEKKEPEKVYYVPYFGYRYN